ncbi:MAG: hypothetical protein GX622_11495 [Bacteroidales bacterium]|nr:hypothetical protein [Bacteroidales bacterium]
MSGSVYNRTELDRNTDIPGQLADPQLVADLFLREGHGFVEKLNGDFAIFILKPDEKQAFLIRDHLGICPVAWVTEGKTLLFSSDITSLARYFSDGRNIDSEFLLGYFKYTDYRKTPDERIRKLLPGHILHFSERGIELKKYWEPEKVRLEREMSYDSMLHDLKALVTDAVRIRSDDRYTAGAHVSSGIDSGIVSALARKEYSLQSHFCGLSWSPAGDFDFRVKYDERELVLISCENAGIRPLFSEMGEDEFPKYISAFYHNRGYFSEDETSDRAVALGVNLIFSGFGGDEFISTGHSGIDLDLLRGLRFRTFFRKNSIKSPKKFIRHFLFFVVNPLLGILDRRTRRAFRDDATYLKKSYRKSNREALRNFYFHKSRRRMHLNVFDFYNIPERCESWHIMGFRKGILYRYPLLDKRIVEYMLSVPSELLCRTGHFRPLLREISKGIVTEEVRLNESKNDPVYWSWMDGLFKSAAIRVMDEINIWRGNTDLDFVDFGLLSDAVAAYRSKSAPDDDMVLFRTLVYLKSIHEFTGVYRRQITTGAA